MNFGKDIANWIINFFGFSSDMAIGLAAIAGVAIMIGGMIALSASVVIIGMRMGWIKEGDL